MHTVLKKAFTKVVKILIVPKLLKFKIELFSTMLPQLILFWLYSRYFPFLDRGKEHSNK